MIEATPTRSGSLPALLGLVLVTSVFSPPSVDADAGGANAPSADTEQGEIRFVLLGVDAEQGGVVRCALYRDEESWLDEARRYKRASARVRRGQAACVFRGVPAGTYGIAALHDADGDAEMDRSLVGLPQEGYALSRNARPRLRGPDFDSAAVTFDGGQLVTRARMRY